MEFEIGDRVVIHIKYITIGLGGKKGKVRDVRPPDMVPADHPYKDGMVDVDIDGEENQERWFSPSDLTPCEF